MRVPHRVLASAAISGLCTIPLSAQKPSAKSADPAALRQFAAGGVKAGQDIKWDPNFRALMQQSLHQHQYFWRDHGNFTALPNLIETFIGVPGEVTATDNRYLTITGCVPHDCGDAGMVWIDTAAAKPTVIFVAENDINTSAHQRRSEQHFWLFSSTQLDWQHLPQPFVDSFSKWYGGYRATWAKYFDRRAAIITIVQPTGDYVDLGPALLGLNSEGGAAQ